MGKEGSSYMGDHQGQGFLERHASYEDYYKKVFGSVIKCVKGSVNLKLDPSDYEYFNTLPEFKEAFGRHSGRVLSLIQAILVQYQRDGDPVELGSQDDIGSKYDILVDALDGILEKANNLIDEVNVSFKKSNDKKESHVVIGKVSSDQTGRSYNIVHSKSILRPQLQFKEPVDNSYSNPWFPKLRLKQNAIEPLVDYKKLYDKKPSYYLKYGFPHPYGKELSLLEPQPKFWTEARKEVVYSDINQSDFILVEDVEALQELLVSLRACEEFAVDLEHHNYRTYQGFTCLMQVSTRSEDFIVDTIALRSELHLLNEVFSDSSKLKVLHGADQDIMWLQKDLGLYIVNMFDTGQAARVLEYPSFSLAYLLEFFCGVKADKKYQLADWRIRPLPSEMMKYAREDTHYLLYIYDRMRNQLLERGNSACNLALSVFRRSVTICEGVYTKPFKDENSYIELYKKYNRRFSPYQLSVFKSMFDWRDSKAREEDESARYVLPNHMLLEIASAQPTDTNELFACCNPIPTFVKLNANEICSLVEKSKLTPIEPGDLLRATAMDTRETVKEDTGKSASLNVEIKPKHTLQPSKSLKKATVVQRSFFSPNECNVDVPLKQCKSKLGDVLRQNAIDSKTKLSAVLEKVARAAMFSPILAGFKIELKTETHIPSSETEQKLVDVNLSERRNEEKIHDINKTSKSEEDQGDEEFERDVVFNLREMKSKAKTNVTLKTNDKSLEGKEGSRVETSKSNFVPFDYSKANAVFSEASSSAAADLTKKRKYDPYSDVVEPKHKKTPKANLAPKTGIKSFSYSNEQKVKGRTGSKSKGSSKSASSKIAWPKK